MPIFIDRHDMRDVTSEKLAEAHRRDLEIQDKYGVKYLTYWFDDRRRTAFCLVDAPDAAAAEHVHREAHGEIPTAIIPVDLAVVEAFLGRIADPHAAPGAAHPTMDAGMRAVMFTDIVGSTELTERLGDASAFELVQVHNALVRRGLTGFGGREIKHTGDGIMAAFDEVPNAAAAAAEIQRQFAAYNVEAAQRLSVRIGIDAGEPVADHDDLFGSTVQLAYRLCTEAEADAVLVSRLVRELCQAAATRFAPLGERRLKGFAEPVPVFRLEWRDAAAPPFPASDETPRSQR